MRGNLYPQHLILLAACWFLPLALSRPPCNYTHCPVCLDLDDAGHNLSGLENLTFAVGSSAYSTPLRIGRCRNYWASHTMLGQALGILAQDRLGIRVEFVNCEDETMCHLAILACSDWAEYGCSMPRNDSERAADVAAGRKRFDDPLPDIMVDLESWPVAQQEEYMGVAAAAMDWQSRPSMVVGSTGFTTRNVLFAFSGVLRRAWEESRTILGHYLAYTTGTAHRYLVAPNFLSRLGIQAEIQGCPGTDGSKFEEAIADGMKLFADRGYTCNNSWWRTTACAALGDSWADECVAVIDGDWGYPKPDLYRSLQETSMRVAVLIIGYDAFYNLVQSGIDNIMFTSYLTDITFANKAEEVRLQEVQDLVISKLAWTPLLRANVKLRILLQQLLVDNRALKSMLGYFSRAESAGYVSDLRHAPGFAQKVVCDWMHDSRAVWSPWLPNPRTCMVGETFVSAEFVCRPCREGTFWKRGTETSDPRPVCEMCSPGRFSAELRATECQRCPLGFHQPLAGSVACVACQVGSYAAASGQPTCTSCMEGLTTQQTGAHSPLECICPAGTFATETACKACAPMLDCVGGVAPPQQQAGFWVEEIRGPEGQNFHPWRCRSSGECPAGPAGSCAAGRAGRACHRCVQGYYAVGQGECAKCGPGDLAPSVVGAILAAFFCIAAPLISRPNLNKMSLSRLTVLITAGQLLTVLQACTSFASLEATFDTRSKTLLSFLQLFAFNFDILKIKCLQGSSDPVLTLLVKLGAFPCGILLMFVGTVLSRCTSRSVSRAELLNLIGMILFAIYTGMCLAMLLPLQCHANPAPNTAYTMLSSPGVICWQWGKHAVLGSLSVLGFLLYPAPLFSVAFWITMAYPSQVAVGKGYHMNVQYRFLFGRFRPERYYYGLVLLLRNLVLALTPIVLSDIAVVNLLVLALVAFVSAITAAILWPWRTASGTITDVCMNATLFCAAFCAQGTTKNVYSAVSNILFFSTVVSPFIVGTAAVALALYKRLLSPWSHDVFLCHNRLESGALCRFIQLVAQRQGNCRVFIDTSSHLGYDELFDVVRCSSRNVAVILTPRLLQKTWCLGEIVTASVNNVKVVPIVCDGFCAPSEESIANILRGWTHEQVYRLQACGISVQMVGDAIKWLLGLEMLTLPRFGTLGQQELVVSTLLCRCRLRPESTADEPEKPDSPFFCIVGDSADAEATSACRVAQLLVTRISGQEARALHSMDDVKSLKGTAFCLIVMLSKGILKSWSFAHIFLALAGRGDLDMIPVTADKGFEKPPAGFYRELDNADSAMSGFGPGEVSRLSVAYRTLLEIPMETLTPLGSEHLLERQIFKICARVTPTSSKAVLLSQRSLVESLRSARTSLEMAEAERRSRASVSLASQGSVLSNSAPAAHVHDLSSPAVPLGILGETDARRVDL